MALRNQAFGLTNKAEKNDKGNGRFIRRTGKNGNTH